MFTILDSPRCGTTFLSTALNAHSEITIPEETDFIGPGSFCFRPEKRQESRQETHKTGDMARRQVRPQLERVSISWD
ncbi:MAG: hypothetical protein ACP5SH_26050 [Syntrophobacteraceae bacterium]